MSTISNQNRNNGNGTTDEDKPEKSGVTGRTSAIKIMK
jgi:hypothetical protein